MNLKTTFLTFIAVVSIAFAKAQEAGDCNVMLSIFAENAKAKNYDEAYKQLGDLVTKCPDASAAIYQYGEIIYEHRLRKKIGDEGANAQGLIDMLSAQITKFDDKVNTSKKKIEMASKMYKYGIGDQSNQYLMLEDVFTKDPDNFTDPNGMITYFKLAEKEYKSSKIDLQKLFDTYDALTERIAQVQDERSTVIQELLDKKEAEGSLTEQEEKTIVNQEKNLKNYNIVNKSVNGTLGQLADCDKLIPLYEQDFDSKQSDEKWLGGNVLRRLQSKDCTDAPLYVRSVKALHVLKPSWKTAYGLGNIATTQSEKFQYWDQAIELGADNDTKSRIHYKKAEIFKGKGQYGSAKKEYLASNAAKPSFGLPFLKIANLVASSANSCGSTPFEKRAVNWLAARYADKAGSVDASLKSTAAQTAASYRGRAPQKSEIFMEKAYNSGDTIRFNCWVGDSVRIP
ncbi:hypothetical protein JCM19298_3485 [Nonlabens ulvanivorans]|nr:hypothetical protein [Nonlabens ulvanivorans]GAK92997.1 hypothetical protein JCM19298_3485 [Nonlabens ulvanivorans]